MTLTLPERLMAFALVAAVAMAVVATVAVGMERLPGTPPSPRQLCARSAGLQLRELRAGDAAAQGRYTYDERTGLCILTFGDGRGRTEFSSRFL